MKKNLAKRVVLGLLTGAVLMSSNVVWAASYEYDGENWTSNPQGNGNISIIGTVTDDSTNSIAIGVGSAVGKPNDLNMNFDNGVALGYYAEVAADGGVALGAQAKATGKNSVALGYGSIASGENVVSVGDGGATDGVGTAYRKIVNVAKGTETNDAVNFGQLEGVRTSIEDTIGTVGYHGDNSVIPSQTNTLTGAISVLSVVAKNNQDDIGSVFFENTNYLQEEKDLTEAATKLDELVKANTDAIAGKADAATTLAGYGITDAYTKTYINENFVKINMSGNQNLIESSITIKENNSENPVTIDSDGITVGTNSARIDGSGFYVWDGGTHTAENAKASMTKDGKIKGASGKFEVGADGSVKAAGDKFKVDKDGNVTAEKITAKEVEAENLYTKAEIDEKLGGSNASVAGINQRLDRTNAKINKVGAGAAALAALHPLDYDPDDKLTFSAGMGNYAGENAAALGAFYCPNEKFMVSLGGTMGNGENMVNLGISIGLDKANGFAKMSKRELIQEVNAVKAENEAIKADNEAMKAEMAEMKAMLQELLAKK